MRHVPRPLARRIDRLARGAHAFHRFAHHPLCAPYAGEVVRIGRRARVCRGCSLALAGVAAGAAVGTVVPVPGIAVVAALAGTMAAWASTASPSPSPSPSSSPIPTPIPIRSSSSNAPSPRPSPPLRGGEGVDPFASRLRRPKILTRFAPGALASATAALGLRSATAAGAAAALLAAGAAALALVRYRRRGPDRSACRACPERALPSTCTGLRPIARREAAFRRAAAHLLLGA